LPALLLAPLLLVRVLVCMLLRALTSPLPAPPMLRLLSLS
jgi:hypothetical protein